MSEEEVTPPLLTSVSVVCRQFNHNTAELAIEQSIDSFLDKSRGYSLRAACQKSVNLANRVLARMELNQGQIAAELCDFAGHEDVQSLERLCQALEKLTSANTDQLLNERDALGNSPLSKAVWRGNIEMLQWLVSHGACLSTRNDRGQNVLHQAASEGNVAVVEWLVHQGRSVADKDGDGCTALLKAARKGRFSVAKWLVENGALVTERNNSGQSALHLSAGGLRENVALVEFFIDNGLHVSEHDNFGNTALHYAAIAHNFDIAEFLLRQSYDEEQPMMSDLFKLLFAASKADEFVFVEYLIANFGVDLDYINEQGRTALHEAVVGDGLEVSKILLDYGAKISQADNLGITPIIEASRCGNARVLGSLLSAEWNTEAVDLSGRTALHHAAAGGHLNVMDILLYDADVNCCDKRGWTPLHCAAASGRFQAVKKLLENGAEISVETISGKTPLVLSIERGQSDLAEFFMKQSSSISTSETTTEVMSSSANELRGDFKEYRLDPSDIHFGAPLLQDRTSGSWLGSPIEVKVKKTWQSKNFVQELGQWAVLSHPHVVKMYGYCHGEGIEDPFFVYERPAYGSLFEYLATTSKQEIWDKMYQAAMGLEYLHDRDIVHGDISCISIAVAANGVAKLKNLGSENDELFFRQNPTWTSPEILSGSPTTFQSDVYMFGLAIVQAFKTSGDLWDIFGGARDDAIRSGKLPLKPAEITSAQWRLVQRMCCFDPQERLSASDIVRELEVFTHRSQMPMSDLEENNGALLCWANVGDHVIEYFVTSEVVTVGNALAEIHMLSTASSTSTVMIRAVYDRMIDIFEQFKTRTDTPRMDLVERYSSMVYYFLSRLKSVSSFELPRAARIVIIRRVAEICFSGHGIIDLFMETASLDCTSSIHDWRYQWELDRQEQTQLVWGIIEDISTLFKDVEDEKEREEAATYLRFELTKHTTSYIATKTSEMGQAKTIVAAFATSKNADWFIPAYEVQFNKFNEFNRGAFGSVHYGKWKHAQVVVKKLNLMTEKRTEDSGAYLSDFSDIGISDYDRNRTSFQREELAADFLNEVKIWHKLHHPNVVQLFGACHVGNPIFVCEYAGGGQLDNYLRTHPKEVLDKLFEAALGLRYLHVKQVVHADLKCNNILLGDDGRAKLTDFGLSSLQVNSTDNSEEPEAALDKPQVGAIRWKAPEVLQGEKPTFASDVYSFGMCILEAVSGKFPWGTQMPDVAVKYKVVTARCIPQRPSNCNEGTYHLVERMCQFDPNKRVRMNEVVEALNGLRST